MNSIKNFQTNALKYFCLFQYIFKLTKEIIFTLSKMSIHQKTISDLINKKIKNVVKAIESITKQ